jgi:purine nucleoside permease
MISEQLERGRLVKFLSCLAAALIAAGSAHAAPLAPKVIVITMFMSEAANWLQDEKLDQKLSVPGLSKAFPSWPAMKGASAS